MAPVFKTQMVLIVSPCVAVRQIGSRGLERHTDQSRQRCPHHHHHHPPSPLLACCLLDPPDNKQAGTNMLFY